MSMKLFWWQSKRQDQRENYGDLMSKYLVEKISKKKVKTVSHPSKFPYNFFRKHYISIGSIISSANANSIVWGSGIIKKCDSIANADFRAVRGPKTRQRIIEMGYDCPEKYGDPALLLPKYYQKKDICKYELGIIPHYVDYEAVHHHFKDEKTVKVIDLLTKDIEKTTDEIMECEKIISSSLHGVIVSQAYQIPALWVKFSDKLFGDDIKFQDYFDSVNIKTSNSIHLDVSELGVEDLNKILKENSSILMIEDSALKRCQDDLITSCPFIYGE